MSTELMRLPAAVHWTASGAGAAAAVAALIRGIGSRVTARRRRREEDAVARLIAAHGGVLTDDLERRISAQLMGGGLT